MNSPLRRFRDLLPFAGDTAENRAVEAVHRELEAIAALPPLEIAAQLTESALPGAVGQANLHMRFKLLEAIRQLADGALPTLEHEVTTAPLPLPLPAASAALHADNLLKRMAQSYAHLAQHTAEGPQRQRWSPLFHRCIQRALALIARRQRLAYRAYAMPSAASWRLLHELYRLGCGTLTQPLNGDTAPIEREYLEALIFAFIEPNRLQRGELDDLLGVVRQLAAYAAIADASEAEAAPHGFIVCPDAGHPGAPLARSPADGSRFGRLFVDCTQVVAAIDRNIARLPGQRLEPDLIAAPGMLQSLRMAIAGKGMRRYSRTRFRPRCDLVSGLDSVIAFLDGRALSRRAVDAATQASGEGLASSEWSMIDESPDGFCLRFVKGAPWRHGVGELVALQPRESGKVHVCLIRRIAARHNALEIGLQLLSPQTSLVSIATADGTSARAVFLHSLPAYGPFPGLIAAPGEFQRGMSVTVHLAERKHECRIGKCIEANEGLEFHALDPLFS